MVKIAIMGFGTVGSGVVELIRKNSKSISNKTGKIIDIKYILDIRDFPNSPEKDILTKDVEDILKDDKVSIVVEVMGGIEPAYTFTKRALLSGKHVVTSNKELVASHGRELLSIAKQMNVNYLFEASVGGGIPIIRPLNQCLAGNEITEIIGILNGTTNYILTQMAKYGQTFEDALKDAQKKGYAERDPSADIEGHDTCRKIAILSSLVFGTYVDFEQIPTEGITNISKTDVEYAKRMGCVIKLLAVSKKVDNKLIAYVGPAIIEKEHSLANVEGVFNAILVKGDAVGDVMFYGKGAGKLPTASAVVGDIIDCIRHIDNNNNIIWLQDSDNFILSIDEIDFTYFVRVKVKERTLLLSKINELLPKSIFIDLNDEKVKDEIAFLTPTMKNKDLLKKIDKIQDLDGVKSLHKIIKIDDNKN